MKLVAIGDEEHKHLKILAAEGGVTMSTYVASLIEDEFESVRKSQEVVGIQEVSKTSKKKKV